MLGENKNLKDTSKDSIKDTSSASTSLTMPWRDQAGYFNKINKLITALYIVTDTMEKDEPLRLKLRTFGVEILSDIASLPKGTFGNLDEKITAILSLLNIAFDVRMVSEMNFNILKKEFLEMKQSIQEFTKRNNAWLEEFINTSSPFQGKTEEGFLKNSPHPNPLLIKERGQEISKGQGTRIGVQKGSTLMKALNKVESGNNNFEIIKKQRRESIIKIIKNKPIGASIKDIILAVRNLGEEMGEKTLQRELVSMVKDNVLKKTGEKRWSLYFINS